MSSNEHAILRSAECLNEGVNRKEQRIRPLIIGATGGLGRELVRRAPERRHEVTALARDPSRIIGQDERGRAVRGDVLDPASVDLAVRGQDAVVSALGTPSPRKPKPSTLLSEGTKNIVGAR